MFAKGVARALGVTEPVVSPSFTIVREYEGTLPLVHVDVYRIDHLQELHDIGFDELVGDDAVTVVEWGDRVERDAARRSPGSDDRAPTTDDDDARHVQFDAVGRARGRRGAATRSPR